MQIFLCVSTSEAEPPPSTHYHFNHCLRYSLLRNARIIWRKHYIPLVGLNQAWLAKLITRQFRHVGIDDLIRQQALRAAPVAPRRRHVRRRRRQFVGAPPRLLFVTNFFLLLKWLARILATSHNNYASVFGLIHRLKLTPVFRPTYLTREHLILLSNISSKPRRVMSCHDCELK